MITAFLLASYLALPDPPKETFSDNRHVLSEICKNAAKEYLDGTSKDNERANHACYRAYTKEHSKEAAWHLHKIYEKTGDEESAEYWLVKADTVPEAAMIIAKRFEDQKLYDKAIRYLLNASLVEDAIFLYEKLNIVPPKSLFDKLEGRENPKAQYIRGKLKVRTPKAAKEEFLKAAKEIPEAKSWLAYLDGKVPDLIPNDLLDYLSDLPETKNNIALADKIINTAIERKNPKVLKKLSEKIDMLPDEKKEMALDILSVYAEYARKNAMFKKRLGKNEQAKELMRQASLLGDIQALYVVTMQKPETTVAEKKKKAKIISNIFFSKKEVPEQIKLDCARWLAFYFTETESQNIEIACEMAEKAHLSENDKIAFANSLFLSGSIDRARIWLAKCENTKNPEILHHTAIRWKQLREYERLCVALSRFSNIITNICFYVFFGIFFVWSAASMYYVIKPSQTDTKK